MHEKRLIQNGQIVLIVLLVVTIATTVGISLIARNTKNVSISNQIDQSSRAFSAAEAGLEVALKSGTAPPPKDVVPGQVHYEVSREVIGGTSRYKLSKKIIPGDTATIWLSPHNANGELVESGWNDNTLTLCWNEATPPPAVIVSVFYKRGSTYLVARNGFDPSGSRRHDNNFNDDDGNGLNCGESGYYKKQLLFTTWFGYNSSTDKLLALRIRPVYSEAQIIVSASSPFPAQGYRYDSSGITAEGTTRTVSAESLYKTPASIFDYAVYVLNGNFAQ